MAKIKKKKTKPRKKRSTLGKQFSGMLSADGFDKCAVGYTMEQPNRPALIVYDYEMCVRVLMDHSKMEYGEAVEYMDYNVIGSWVGDNTPVFIINRHREF